MKTQIVNTAKKTYKAPKIERIRLDNEISLALESTPPTGPGEPTSQAPEYFNNDPFKATFG